MTRLNKKSVVKVGILLIVCCLTGLQFLAHVRYLEVVRDPLSSFGVSSHENVRHRFEKHKSESSLADKVNNETRFCLIHVGKTAGSKVSCELGQLYGEFYCDFRKKRKSALKEAFIGSSHMYGARKQCEHSNFDSFLYTLRNPLDRLVSWYYYEHPSTPIFSNKLYCKNVRKFHKHLPDIPDGCFETLEDFASNCINTTNATECQRLAYKVASGQELCGCSGHNSLGYKHYHQMMQKLTQSNITYTLLAIRTEQLAEDWDKLEGAFQRHYNTEPGLNGTVRFRTRSGIVQKTLNGTKPTTLSRQGRLNLCRALCQEVQVYKELLFAAENLDEAQVNESLSQLVASCPEETFEIRNCT